MLLWMADNFQQNKLSGVEQLEYKRQYSLNQLNKKHKYSTQGRIFNKVCNGAKSYEVERIIRDIIFEFYAHRNSKMLIKLYLKYCENNNIQP